MSRYFDDYLFHSDDPYLKQSNRKYWLTDKGKKVPKICDKCGGEVHVVIDGEPIFKCHDCHKYFGTVAFPGSFPEEMYHADTETYFGLPDERKFPLDSRQHVMSAIKFFNYCPPQKRRFLAKRIKERMKVFGIRYDSLTESKENSFYNYTGYD